MTQSLLGELYIIIRHLGNTPLCGISVLIFDEAFLLVSGCMYKGQDCRLVIHYELGFSVLPEGEPPHGHPLFSYPFEKLRMSSDDGVRMLYLDFGGKEGEIVS